MLAAVITVNEVPADGRHTHSTTASVYFPFMGLWRSCGDKENVSREFSMSRGQAATSGGRMTRPFSLPLVLGVVNPGLGHLLRAQCLSRYPEFSHLQGIYITLTEAFVSRQCYGKS